MAAAQFTVTVHHDDTDAAVGIATALRRLLLAILQAGDTHGAGLSLTHPLLTRSTAPAQFPPPSEDDHSEHVHIAPMDDGGMLPGGPEFPGPLVLNTGRPVK